MTTKEDLKSLAPKFAEVAQAVYDGWIQDEDDELNGGGICHLIADKVVEVLDEAGIRCATQSTSVGENHVYAVAVVDDGVFEVDIPYHLYETGSMFKWTKIEGVKFSPDDVVVAMLDPNPENAGQYAEGLEEEDSYGY